MSLCEYCGKGEGTIQHGTSKICKKCNDRISEGRCIRCGKILGVDVGYNGMCSNCTQLYIAEKSKEEFYAEAQAEADRVNELRPKDENGDPIITFTTQDYEKWLTWDPDHKGFNVKDFEENTVLRRIWIIVKFYAAGYFDTETINENMEDVEKLINKHIKDLIGHKCGIKIISKVSETRGYNFKDHSGKVYLYFTE